MFTEEDVECFLIGKRKLDKRVQEIRELFEALELMINSVDVRVETNSFSLGMQMGTEYICEIARESKDVRQGESVTIVPGKYKAKIKSRRMGASVKISHPIEALPTESIRLIRDALPGVLSTIGRSFGVNNAIQYIIEVGKMA